MPISVSAVSSFSIKNNTGSNVDIIHGDQTDSVASDTPKEYSQAEVYKVTQAGSSNSVYFTATYGEEGNLSTT
jgi:hypothetical protein